MYSYGSSDYISNIHSFTNTDGQKTRLSTLAWFLIFFLYSLIQSFERYITTKSAKNCFNFKQENVKQSTAPTITRTPIHILSCILEYTIAGRLTELWECRDYSAKNERFSTFSWQSIMPRYQRKILNEYLDVTSTLVNSQNSSYTPNYTCLSC